MASDVGILSGRMLFMFQRELFARLAAEGHDAVRHRHGAVMAYLDAEGTRATELGVRSRQHKVIVGRLIDELEELGYVTREPDPGDRRAKLVVPTERGQDYLRRARAITDDITATYRRELGARDWDAFIGAFERVVALAASHAPEADATADTAE